MPPLAVNGTNCTLYGVPVVPLGSVEGEIEMGSQQRETLFVSNATAPPASNLPETLAPFLRVMFPSASMVPTNTVPSARVTEPPTRQNTFEALAPLVRRTAAFGSDVSGP